MCPYKPYFVSGLYVFPKAVLLFLSLLAFSLTFFLTLQFNSKMSDVQHADMLIDFLVLHFFYEKYCCKRNGVPKAAVLW